MAIPPYCLIIFQSTLPRGSDFDCFPFVDFLLISIHAPSRERHVARQFLYGNLDISIHAPSRERLYMDNSLTSNVIEFQSTLPRGSDRLTPSGFFFCPISIHAPSRERPKEYIAMAEASTISIHAPSRERLQAYVPFAYRQAFQSTLPRGSDRRSAGR